MSEEIMGVSPSLGDAGTLATIKHKGKTWTVGAPTQKAKSAFEDYVLEIASANVDRAKGKVSAARWQSLNDKLDSQISSGQYLTWGKLWNEVNQSPDSVVVYLATLIREHDDSITLDIARQIAKDEPRQVKHAIMRGVPDFFLMLVKESGDEGSQKENLLNELLATFQSAMQDAPGDSRPDSSLTPTNS